MSRLKHVLIVSASIVFLGVHLKAQDKMKKKFFGGITFYEISDQERDVLLAGGSSSEEYKADLIYDLADGRVIYEMKYVKNYLFNSRRDFDLFIEKIEHPQGIGGLLQTYTHPIEDDRFIEKREMYVAFFVDQYNVEIDVSSLDELDKLDDLLNELTLEELKEYRLSIIALIGDSIVSNFEGARWVYLNIPNPQGERAPVIIIKGKTLIDPASVYYEEYNKKVKDFNYKISVSRAIRGCL